MENNTLVSIIIPVYNVRPYLEEALDSAVHQTYENLEIIIVDDGSTDDSGEICDMYAARDERITVIHQDNRGLSSARNAGLDIMRGEYVAFLDPDDAYHPEYVQELIAAAIREKTDIVICRYTNHKTESRMSCSGKERKEPALEAGIYNRLDALRALADGKINHAVWNKIYRAYMWTNNRYPDGQVFEDVDTTYRILDRCSSVCAIDKSLYMKRC